MREPVPGEARVKRGSRAVVGAPWTSRVVTLWPASSQTHRRRPKMVNYAEGEAETCRKLVLSDAPIVALGQERRLIEPSSENGASTGGSLA